MKNRLNKFNDLISSRSWLILYIGFLPLFLVIFKPSFWELIVYLGIEGIFSIIALPLEQKSLLQRNPLFNYFYKEIKFEEIASLEKSQKKELLYEMFLFPYKRALHATYLNIYKVTPAALVIIFYWDYPHSTWLQALLYLALPPIPFLYFFATSFIENHFLISHVIRELHEKQNWSETFKEFQPPENINQQFNLIKKMSVAGMAAFSLVLIALIVLFRPETTPTTLFIQIFFIIFASLLWFSHIWLLFDQFLNEGLAKIFHQFGELQTDIDYNKTVSLHTYPTLAHYEKTFNALILKLSRFEEELAQWVMLKTLESRYYSLGEKAALVAHDLKNPLHVVQFCGLEIKENPQNAYDPNYISQILLNTEEALSLVESLQAYLKEPKDIVSHSSVFDIIDKTLKLLKTQYSRKGFSKIDWKIDLELKNIYVGLSAPNMMHILMNLIGNSIVNLLENNIMNPEIECRSGVSKKNGMIELFIEDNGTGLTPKRFEEMTGFVYQSVLSTEYTQSLGLRLTRRLIEVKGGKLRMSTKKSVGTSFVIELPQTINQKVELNKL